ncbi:MAG: [protein-PII] uridylyltransferase [Deltaproteobacteria bacterium]|nr:[protein-PII] uridylyltransferase [Deltaproteobacteria bacterium]
MSSVAVETPPALVSLAPTLASVCKEYVGRHRRDLERRVAEGAGGLEIVAEHARVTDGMLRSLWCALEGTWRGSRVGLPRLAVVAVGGYGREQVGLRSDIDLLFLCEDEADPRVRSMAEALLYPLWDAGTAVGHATRGITETLRLARSDLRTATTLLDVRLIAGDATLLGELVTRGWREVFDPDLRGFLDRLRADSAERHERFGGSLYLLEPEIKQGRGGLRDVDVALWAARARWHSCSLEDLVRTGALSARESSELVAARDFLWRVRNHLHRRAGRRQDRLTFEDQEEIARSLGFEDHEGGELGVEQFNRTYFGHARTIARVSDMLVERAYPRKRRGRAREEALDGGILKFDDHVTFADSARLDAEPAMALRLYAQAAARDAPPYGYARDAITRLAADPLWCARLRGSTEAAETFLRLLCRPAPAPVPKGSILTELHDVGLLLALVPEFGPVTGRVQHDVYHVYTVDVHSIAAVDRLRAIHRGDLVAELPLPSRLAAEIIRPIPLYLGLLLHDIGKAQGKDHARKGAVIARQVATRLGLSEPDVSHVEWLVLEHLSLYHTATRRDIADTATLVELCERVGSAHRLRDLYLLTIADLSTTNPNAMTTWKARMLDDLHYAAERFFEQGGVGFDRDRADLVRAEVRHVMAAEPDVDRLYAFVRQMSDRYVLGNPIDAIRIHAAIARDRGSKPVHAALGAHLTPESVELVVVTDDRPGLLADLAAVVAAHRLEVVDAQIHSRRREDGTVEVFDLFHVRRRAGGPITDDVLPKLARDLDAVVTGAVSAAQLLEPKLRASTLPRRRDPNVPTEIRVENAASDAFTVVDVFTRDRPGLLYTIARTLADEGLSIALSKINTEGARAADVFYVTDAEGKKIDDAARLGRVSLRLRDAILALDQPRSEAQ